MPDLSDIAKKKAAWLAKNGPDGPGSSEDRLPSQVNPYQPANSKYRGPTSPPPVRPLGIFPAPPVNSPVPNSGNPNVSGNPMGGGNAPSGTSALDKMYAALTGSLTQTGVDNNALIDKSIETIKDNYGDATLDTYKRYQDSRDELTGRATNLGVDLDASKMGETWDASLRRLQEMSDSNMNSDLSYMEKMRLIKQSAIDALLMGSEQDKLARIAGMMSGGGGSSRGGGGRGGSGSASGSATETMTVDNIGDIETYNELLKTDPAAANLYWSAYLSNSLDPDASIGALQTKKSSIPANFFGHLWGAEKAGKTASKKIKSKYDAAIQAMLGISGKGGNPKGQQKVTHKGK